MEGNFQFHALAALSSLKEPPFINLRGPWVGARVGLGVWKNRKFLILSEQPAQSAVTILTEL
jgi:hypothetical protein